MNKELFDKMLRAAILKDRINYTAGLISEVQAALPYEVGAVKKLSQEKRLEFYREKNGLGVEPLSYDAMLKDEIKDAQSRAILMSGKDYDRNAIWEQRRYEIAKDMLPAIYVEDGQAKRADHSDLGFEYKSLQGSAKEAVRFADALIEELKRTNNESKASKKNSQDSSLHAH